MLGLVFPGSRYITNNLREKGQKRVLLLMAGPLRPNLSLSSLMAAEIFEHWKKGFQKSHFFLNGPALYPPPPLMARPLREEFFQAEIKSIFLMAVPVQLRGVLIRLS